jgi:hypothetical protein
MIQHFINLVFLLDRLGQARKLILQRLSHRSQPPSSHDLISR